MPSGGAHLQQRHAVVAEDRLRHALLLHAPSVGHDQPAREQPVAACVRACFHAMPSNRTAPRLAVLLQRHGAAAAACRGRRASQRLADQPLQLRCTPVISDQRGAAPVARPRCPSSTGWRCVQLPRHGGACHGVAVAAAAAAAGSSSPQALPPRGFRPAPHTPGGAAPGTRCRRRSASARAAPPPPATRGAATPPRHPPPVAQRSRGHETND
jgi:hypothetical protein